MSTNDNEYPAVRKRARTISEMREDIAEMRARADEIMTRSEGDLSGDDADQFEELTANLQRAKAELADAEARVQTLKGAGSNQVDSPAAPRRTANTGRDIAMRSIDAGTKRGLLDGESATTAEKFLKSAPAGSWAERYIATTGSEAYERAWAKAVSSERGHLTWTGEESEAFRAVSTVQNEMRGLGLGSQGGAYQVPLSLDPSVILTNAGAANPLREISRIVQITTDSWHGVNSAGATAEWKAEAVEIADGSPTYTAPDITAHAYDVFSPFSFEVEMDALNFIKELQRVIADAAGIHTGLAYATGASSGQPIGIRKALIDSAGSASLVDAAGEAITDADIYKLQNALPARYQVGASWS